MSVSIVLGYLLSVVMGVMGGFFITSKESDRHANELRLGTIIFIIVCVIWIMTGNFTTAVTGVLHMGGLWLLLSFGIYLGEKVHGRLVKHFMDSLKKQDIEYGISELVRMGQQVYIMQRFVDMERFRNQCIHVLACLTELKRKSVNIKRPDIGRQVDNVAELVIEYSNLVQAIAAHQESDTVGHCAEIGNDLLEVANYMLAHAEHVLRGVVSTRFTVGVFR